MGGWGGRSVSQPAPHLQHSGFLPGTTGGGRQENRGCGNLGSSRMGGEASLLVVSLFVSQNLPTPRGVPRPREPSPPDPVGSTQPDSYWRGPRMRRCRALGLNQLNPVSQAKMTSPVQDTAAAELLRGGCRVNGACRRHSHGP